LSNQIKMNNHGSQSEAPFLEEVLRYSDHPLKAFHTPGHKAGLGLEQEWLRSGLCAQIDLTEIGALDWDGVLNKAQKLAAEFYEADQSFFLVQGASQGILAVILGAFAPGDKVLVARNCHSSVIHAIVLADLLPIYLELEFLNDWGLPIGIRQKSLQQALTANPDCKGIILTNPTYQGVAEPLGHYRELIGDRLLIIDEAHGGYLGWSGLNGLDAYPFADAWVQGTHKMLGSLTQTGMLHLRGSRIDRARVNNSLELITTTSPSYILLASLDSNRRFLATTGRELFRQNLEMVTAIKKNIAEQEQKRGQAAVAVLDNDQLAATKSRIDPWKLCLSFNRLGWDGYQVERRLRNEFGIQAEYADLNQVTFLMAPWQNPDDLKELQNAVIAIGTGTTGNYEPQITYGREIPPLQVRPHQAVFAPSCSVGLRRAVGLVSSAIIAPYPPGIPLIGPGEIIREPEVDVIEKNLQLGGIVRGVSPEGEIRIVTGL
jgi:arginine/lysine/ornithine decarboxylase